MWSRRQFVRRTGAFAAATGLGGAGLASCSGGQSGPAPQLAQLFSSDRVLAAGRPERVSFGIINDGIPLTEESRPFPIKVSNGTNVIQELEVAGRVVTHDHPDGNALETHQHSSILRYYAFTVIFPEPGIYDIEIDLDGRIGRLPVQAFDQAEVSVLGPGDRFPAIVSPTFDDPSGVDPVCTLAPEPCAFHVETAAAVLESGRPMAYLVATPAFCRTQYCGPVLQVLIELAPEFPAVTMVHQEVYSNAREVNGNIDSPDIKTAPQLVQLNLSFEPSLFTVNRNGLIVQRVDNVFDNTELRDVLGRL